LQQALAKGCCKSPLPFLVPKLRLGTHLRPKLCFGWKGCLRAGN